MYLTINTSSDLLTVTLADKAGNILDHRTADAHLNHASLLMPTIRKILGGKETGLAGLICAQGPGSFTGIRIGLTTANALAYGFDIPIVAVSVLDAWLLYALHFFAPADASFARMHQEDLTTITSAVTLIDAGRDEAYAAIYRREKGTDPLTFASWKQTGEPHLVALPQPAPQKPAVSPALLTELTCRSIITGALKSKYADALVSSLGDDHLPLLYFDQAIDLGRELTGIGLTRFSDMKHFKDSGQIAPLYIREAQITQSKKETLA
ncbi:tRNA (adenosine(37)-N6)-threonylcarbamoyltransferase complex dimerization subunit type 1 TsaB [Candidatus Wirthbacteria bacterium CG2_30_54_11]|uniref:tRNA (Adenosine(37)-N6)-threonylcarbamoyltransferase complex dimerization subunit type 1 TsaB n=1 Tax=Candidatus Wirthbacteria bacterium CG2_30_54_11 TaxID=1817892 RepID=A0A1J5ICP5_9BACT|nr:MAG: tRNA (adenosine(37)-N6)-threonylcarbamoyltransferase complex dimerization subunit type 1 TsaB [Candidatus Wirthbacteria bacterium CG2_30_54_11]